MPAVNPLDHVERGCVVHELPDVVYGKLLVAPPSAASVLVICDSAKASALATFVSRLDAAGETVSDADWLVTARGAAADVEYGTSADATEPCPSRVAVDDMRTRVSSGSTCQMEAAARR